MRAKTEAIRNIKQILNHVKIKAWRNIMMHGIIMAPGRGNHFQTRHAMSQKPSAASAVMAPAAVTWATSPPSVEAGPGESKCANLQVYN